MNGTNQQQGELRTRGFVLGNSCQNDFFFLKGRASTLSLACRNVLVVYRLESLRVVVLESLGLDRVRAWEPLT